LCWPCRLQRPTWLHRLYCFTGTTASQALRSSDPWGEQVVTRLSRLFVKCMRAVPPAVLLHLDALAVVLLVLHRDVVAPLALLAGQRDLDALLVPCHLFLLCVSVLSRCCR